MWTPVYTPYSNIILPCEGKGYSNLGEFIADFNRYAINYDTYIQETIINNMVNSLNIPNLPISSGIDGGQF